MKSTIHVLWICLHGHCVIGCSNSGDVSDPLESSESGSSDASDSGSACGDGIVEGEEECDAGAENGPGHACTSACLVNVCGDGERGPGEGCDDGNAIDDDGCTNVCALPSCGDGILGAGEQCDDGNAVEDDACLGTCVFASCGDGFVREGLEQCDEGALNSDGGVCTEDCAFAMCGDGLVWQGVEDCDDGNAEEFDGCTSACADSEAPVLELSVSAIKRFEFRWAPVFGAQTYQLLESGEPGAPFVEVGAAVAGLETSLQVPLHGRVHASYKLRACGRAEGCTDSEAVEVVGSLAEAVGYVKASNTDTHDYFGWSVALSGDGDTLVVGAFAEDSSTTGVLGGDQDDNTALEAGAAYVFVRDDTDAWSQRAYVKASNAGPSDHFGRSVALSGDGDTLAVGAEDEGSATTGVGGDEDDDSVFGAGAVYLF